MSRCVSCYTFEDFLVRLQRSPTSYMAPLYHEHRDLFVHRPDMLSRAVASLTWERGCALMSAAYYIQKLEPEIHRSLLARMLLHNQRAMRQQSPLATPADPSGECDSDEQGFHTPATSGLIPWSAAMKVYTEAVVSHGTRFPSRMTMSTLRLLAPHRQWRNAIRILKLCEANDQLSQPMVLEAAHACATPTAWLVAFRLLEVAHRNNPALLPSAVQSLRPEGDNAFVAAAAAHALMPAPERDVKLLRTLEILGDIVAVTPWQTALQNTMCVSYLTHLAASTTLPQEVKAHALTNAVRQLPLEAATSLLVGFTEPHLVPAHDGELSASAPSADTVARHLQSLAATPATVAPMIATLIAKMPTAHRAGEFLQQQLSALSSMADSSDRGTPREAGRSAVHEGEAGVRKEDERLPTIVGCSSMAPKMRNRENIVAALRHPIVLHALLARCSACRGGWEIAASYFPLIDTPVRTSVVSGLALQLRSAKQTNLAVRLLQQVVTTGSKLSPPAVEAMYECILAHNRIVRRAVGATGGDGGGSSHASVHARPDLVPMVHWLSALSWATDLQERPSESRIVVTGTAPSRGAVTYSAPVTTQECKPLSPKLLSILLHICIDGGSPGGALRAMGYARTADKTELLFSEQISAVLFCAMYGRWNEGEAIVRHSERRFKEQPVRPLRLLWEAAKASIKPGED